MDRHDRVLAENHAVHLIFLTTQTVTHMGASRHSYQGTLIIHHVAHHIHHIICTRARHLRSTDVTSSAGKFGTSAEYMCDMKFCYTNLDSLIDNIRWINDIMRSWLTYMLSLKAVTLNMRKSFISESVMIGKRLCDIFWPLYNILPLKKP